MNLWTRRILGVLPIVGCGAGVAVLALAWPSVPRNAATIAIFAGFALAYVFGAVAGLMLLEGRRRATTANFFYWLIQTLQFSSFPLAYAFWAPMSLIAGWNPGESGATFAANVGSTFRLSVLNADEDPMIGLNLFAVLCCALLWLNYRRERGIPVADVDDAAIRAALDADKPGFGRWRLPETAAIQPALAPLISAS